ncbi:MAG: hypothetical protein QOE28_2410 [Solirubrobacteraceae bacterium]|nr:hypothetical protein [Solirubrobacteraceae bacterium]
MPGPIHRLEQLRREALAATQGLSDGQQALVDALAEFQGEKERAADGYRAVVQSLTAALEARDGYTSDHSDEVQLLATAVAARLGLRGAEVEEVEAVAILHDVGKIGIPDRVLHKPGPLDADEWELMRQHPVIGERILRPLPGFSGVARAVRHEHERWDGDGYPDGLAGEVIPLASRIVLACDAWHALVSDRPYRSALSRETARAELIRCRGTQFDPRVIEALLSCLDRPDEAAPELPAPSGDGEQQMRTLERELRALLAIASSLAGAHELDEVLEVTAEEALHALRADALSVCRWDADRELLRTLINVGELADGEVRRPASEVYRLDGEDPLRRVLLDGGCYLGDVEDPELHALERDLLERRGMRSSACVPVMFGGFAWGELWATRRVDKPPFGPRDLRFLRAIAGQIATAIGRAELFSRMAAMALTDELTGLANRRALDERLESAIESALASGHELSLVLCDLDRLKELNDARGHEAGDAALREAADALRELAAPHPRALAARIGGDELCILLEGVGPREAYELAERAVRHLGDGERPVGLSCGVASLRPGGERAADLLRAADSALYLAKRSGRGRACLAAIESRRAWREAAPLRGTGRRALRDAQPVQPGLLADVVNVLDGPLAEAGALLRLEAVLTASAAAVDATAAAISLQAPGDPDLLTQIALDRRIGEVVRRRDGGPDERFPIADYPATAELLDRGGTALWRASDPDADASERALLAEWNMSAALAIAVRDAEGGWLLEVFADDRTADLTAIEPVVRVLAVHALYGGVPADRHRSRAISAAARADTFA